ncbi:MAG: DNA/RNA nuclease SfsA [Bacillota bacterium]
MVKKNENTCRILLPGSLKKVEFVRRLNRFVAEIKIDGAKDLAHVPSSGRMGELLYPGAGVFVAPQARPGSKLRYRILLAEKGGYRVSVDSLLPNRIIYSALVAGYLPELSGYRTVKREAAYGSGRFDFFLAEGPGEGCYLEVKSVTLVEEGVALFPDAPSERGARHLEELAAARREGYRAVVLFVIQRGDAICFRPNSLRDPRFGRGLTAAARAGVEVLARRCRVSLKEVALGEQVPVYL